MKINIKTNLMNNQKVDYYQMGYESITGRFTGIIHDKASEYDTAKAYIIKDKVVSKEQFLEEEKELALQISKQEKELFNFEQKSHYNDKFRCDVLSNDVNLTRNGKVYANSQFNFKALTPVQMGITKFEKKLDKNFFTIAKEFITAKNIRDNIKEKFHEFKINVKMIIKSRPELAASNIALNYQLQEMGAKIEHLQNYQQALELQLEESKKIENNKDVATNQAAKNESEQEQDKELNFGKVYTEAKDIYSKVENINDIKELTEKAPEYKEMRDTAFSLIENIENKEDLISLTSEQIQNLDLNDAKALNMMLENDIPCNKSENIKQFTDLLQKVSDMAVSQNMDFESLLKQTIKEVGEKWRTPEQSQKVEKNKTKNNEIER